MTARAPVRGGAKRDPTPMASKPKIAEPEDEEPEGAEGAEGEQSASTGWRGWLKLPKPSLKLGLIVGGGLLGLPGGGGATFFMFGGSQTPKAAVAPGKPAIFVEVPEVLV